jgi:hypothetical protein|tara:strand:+ start:1415 stop:1606 length:192 start_codon:yes stop_codon:yes gene_type:complete
MSEIETALMNLLELNNEVCIQNLIELEMSYNGGCVVAAFNRVAPDLYQSYNKIIASDEYGRNR